MLEHDGEVGALDAATTTVDEALRTIEFAPRLVLEAMKSLVTL